MITSTEITEFETRLTGLIANFKAEVMAELKKVGIKQPDKFLDELSQSVPLVADEPPPPAEPPNMDGVTLEDEELPFLEKGSDGWKGLVKHLMENSVEEIPQKGKIFQLSDKNWQYLKNMLCYKAELFSGNMSALQIHSQGLDKEDWHWFDKIEETFKSLK